MLERLTHPSRNRLIIVRHLGHVEGSLRRNLRCGIVASRRLNSGERRASRVRHGRAMDPQHLGLERGRHRHPMPLGDGAAPCGGLRGLLPQHAEADGGPRHRHRG